MADEKKAAPKTTPPAPPQETVLQQTEDPKAPLATKDALALPNEAKLYKVSCPRKEVELEVLAIDPTDALAFFVHSKKVDPTTHRLLCQRVAA